MCIDKICEEREERVEMKKRREGISFSPVLEWYSGTGWCQYCDCTPLLILGSQQPPPLCTIRIYCCFLYLHKTIGHKRARGAHCACQSHAEAWICLAAQIARPERTRAKRPHRRDQPVVIGTIRYQELFAFQNEICSPHAQLLGLFTLSVMARTSA